MKIVWQRGSATVREVYEEMLRHRKIAYTTVMTMMGILEHQGALRARIHRLIERPLPAAARLGRWQLVALGLVALVVLPMIFSSGAPPGWRCSTQPARASSDAGCSLGTASANWVMSWARSSASPGASTRAACCTQGRGSARAPPGG